MSKYRYEDQSSTQFEDLVIFLCKHLLGHAVQGFSAGPDGGRDAKFIGRAELIPSKAKQWDGTTIVQAKHTNGMNQTFSDSEFYSPGNKKCILAEEFEKIK